VSKELKSCFPTRAEGGLRGIGGGESTSLQGISSGALQRVRLIERSEMEGTSLTIPKVRIVGGKPTQNHLYIAGCGVSRKRRRSRKTAPLRQKKRPSVVEILARGSCDPAGDEKKTLIVVRVQARRVSHGKKKQGKGISKGARTFNDGCGGRARIWGGGIWVKRRSG